MGQKKSSGPEVSEDLQQQKIEWAVQRVAWVLFSVLLIAIALGLIGRGPLSTARLESPDGAIQMDYERFLRHNTSETLQLQLQPAAGTVRLRISRQFIEHVKLQHIVPTPAQSLLEDEALVLVFKTASTKPVQVALQIKPQHIGRIRGWLQIKGTKRQPFSQFVYP